MKRYRIIANDQDDGFPPFVKDGVGIGHLIVDESDLPLVLEQARDAGLPGVFVAPVWNPEDVNS